MKRPTALIGLAAACVLCGCSSPPISKTLQETQQFSKRTMASYVTDLQTLRNAEAIRKAELTRMDEELGAMQQRVIAAEQRVHEARKAAALHEIEAEYDRQAQQILTQEFWLKLREVRSKQGVTEELDVDWEKVRSAVTDWGSFPADDAARARAIIAARQYLAFSNVDYRFAEEAFAELARNLLIRRDSFLRDAHREIQNFEFKPNPPSKRTKIGNSTFESDIDTRIQAVQETGYFLDLAYAEMLRALDTSRDVKAVVEGFLGKAGRTSNLDSLLSGILQRGDIAPLIKKPKGKKSAAEDESDAQSKTERDLAALVTQKKKEIPGKLADLLPGAATKSAKERKEAGQ